MIEETYEGGRAAWRALCRSPHLAWVPRDISAEDAAALFLPGPEQFMGTLSQPLPKKRREWISGFNDARNTQRVG